MERYIAFLRAVNVGGHNRMKMAELQALFESLGFESVGTYIQSGNVVFESTETDEGALREMIHDAIEEQFGYDISLMIRTREELTEAVSGQPFDVDGADDIRHYVTFLHDEPTDEQLDALVSDQNEAESFVVSGREVYTELDKEALGGGRYADVGEKLGMETTRRNWHVVTAVLELS